jgi:type I restriction enzyme, R subunit
VTDLGRRYFSSDKGFKSNLDRTLRRAAWRMIRQEEGLDDVR